MGLENKLTLFQVTGFVLSFILSFFIFVPLAVNRKDFHGHCLLGADGQWNASAAGQASLINVQWGPNSACNFSIFMGIVLMLLSTFYVMLGSCYLLRQSDSSWLEAFITMFVCIGITVMLFASAVTVTAGFKKWCLLITRPESQIVSCEVADFIPFTEDLNIVSRNFYTQFSVAEFGCWANFVCWLFLTGTAIIKLWKYQQHESFMSSISRERQRLLQKVGHGNQGAI